MYNHPPMTIGTLVHITAAKKLMIKISEETYMTIHNRLTAECKKKNFPTERLAVFSRENDDGEDEHFAMVTPDKYDRQNMPKLEKLLRKDINFSSRMKAYDFMNDDNEQVCGINLELISIHQRVKPKASQELSPQEKITAKILQELEERKKVELMNRMLAMQRDLDEATRTGQKTLDFPQIQVSSSDDSDIDEIEHSKAEARREVAECDAIEKKMVTDLIARMASDKEKHGHVATETLADAEKMISDLPDHATRGLRMLLINIRARSEDVETHMASVLAQLPPKLERQTAITRRRRTPVTSTEQELTDVQKQVKYLDDLIAANERAIGADE